MANLMLKTKNKNQKMESSPKRRAVVSVAVSTVSNCNGWVRDLTREGIEPNPGPKNGNKSGKKVVLKPVKNTPVNRAVAVPKKAPAQNLDRCRLKGSDFITDISFDDADVNRNSPGSVLIAFLITPLSFPGTRMSTMANLYQRYKFTKFNVRYVPGVSAVTVGQFLMACDIDATAVLIGSGTSVNQMMMARKGAKMLQCFDKETCVMPRGARPDYYCDQSGQDLRMYAQGIFFMTVAIPVTAVNGEKWTRGVGSLFLDWECDFWMPRVTLPAVLPSFNQFTAVADTSADTLISVGGAWPNTQCGIMIPKTTGDIVSLSPGAMYFYRVIGRTGTPSQDDGQILLFGTLVGAQRADRADVLELNSGGQDVTVTALYVPVGPPSGIRSGGDTKVTSFTGTGVSEDDTSPPIPLQLQVQDSRFQIEEAEVKLAGATALESQNGSATVFIADNPDAGPGEVVPIGNDSTVLLRSVDTQVLYDQLAARVPGGFTVAQFVAAFGFAPTHKRFLGMVFALVSGVLQAVRVLSPIATQVKAGVEVVRQIRGNSTASFLSRVDMTDGMMWTCVRDQIAYGHKLVFTPPIMKSGPSTFGEAYRKKMSELLINDKNPDFH